MKTALFSPSYLDGLDPLGSDRLIRNIRWALWNEKLKIGDLWLCDNASSLESVQRLMEAWPVNIHRFTMHLPRGHGDNPYPYVWRGLWFIKQLIEDGYDKIITLDTDCFIVSQRLLDYVKAANSGWEVFWIPKYGFPSGELHILNRDAFPLYLEYTKGPWIDKVGQLFESALPFSKINKDFNTDRYGETRIPQTADMDGYFQAAVDVPLVFNMENR